MKVKLNKIVSSKEVKEIARLATGEYIILHLSHSEITFGPFALQRIQQVAQDSNADRKSVV